METNPYGNTRASNHYPERSTGSVRVTITFANPPRQHVIRFENTEQALHYGGLISDSLKNPATVCVSDDKTGWVLRWLKGGPERIINEDVAHSPLPATLQKQAGYTFVPQETFDLMQAVWRLIERYFATPGHEQWTHAELDAAAKEVAEEFDLKVPPWLLVAMFGKIIVATG